jgi:hypothetical protein
MCSSLRRKDFIRLQNIIISDSKRRGVTVKPNCLDISFIGDELVSHPLIRYLNLRNNIIFDKIEEFNNITKESLFSRSDILSLSSYSEEEFIPSMSVDAFFIHDQNELKFKLKNSVYIKSFNSLMNSINS